MVSTVPPEKLSWSVPLIVLAVPVQFQILSVPPAKVPKEAKVKLLVPAPMSMIEEAVMERAPVVSVLVPDAGAESVPPAITIAELSDKTLLLPIKRVPEVMVVLPL